MKILLAEDDHNISKIACLSLEKIGGHQVEWVADGETALKRALQGGYDLILLDEMMPNLNGLKVCELYKQQTENPIPVIFLSAKSQESDVLAFKSLGLGHIPKPFDPMKLNLQIKEIMEMAS
jgi:DNA-binding response OmpR family regulator